MIKKKKLLILYDWFYPGFRAGGPIQSLTNLTLALIPKFDIYVITGAFDLNAACPYDGVIMNSWNDVHLPESEECIKVFYAGKKALNNSIIQLLLVQTAPDIIYLNGIFSYRFFLLPLLSLKKINTNCKVIICPRGMLKKGALSGKAFKKKIYIHYLKLSKLLNNVYWHATTSEELNDIKVHFPLNKGGLVAANIPRKPLINISCIHKKAGELKLVYLSLINEHKNLLLLLQLIQLVHADITLHIYGPVIDEVYWRKCVALIEQMPGKVQYKGAVEPVKVQSLISNYHALILLTKGENFGHAIYESLSVGRPVITTYYTPWQNLCEKQAGANLNLEKAEDHIEKINRFIEMSQDEYNSFCFGAHRMADDYYKNLEAEKYYTQLFS